MYDFVNKGTMLCISTQACVNREAGPSVWNVADVNHVTENVISVKRLIFFCLFGGGVSVATISV